MPEVIFDGHLNYTVNYVIGYEKLQPFWCRNALNEHNLSFSH